MHSNDIHCDLRVLYRLQPPAHMKELRGREYGLIRATYVRWKQNTADFWKHEPSMARMLRDCVLGDVRDSWDRFVSMQQVDA